MLLHVRYVCILRITKPCAKENQHQSAQLLHRRPTPKETEAGKFSCLQGSDITRNRKILRACVPQTAEPSGRVVSPAVRRRIRSPFDARVQPLLRLAAKHAAAPSLWADRSRQFL